MFDSQRFLKLPPDVFEIVEAFFAGEPFGGADGAFGEAAAGLGVVAEVDAVCSGFEDKFVEADHVPGTRNGHPTFTLTIPAEGSALIQYRTQQIEDRPEDP